MSRCGEIFFGATVPKAILHETIAYAESAARIRLAVARGFYPEARRTDLAQVAEPHVAHRGICRAREVRAQPRAVKKQLHGPHLRALLRVEPDKPLAPHRARRACDRR